MDAETFLSEKTKEIRQSVLQNEHFTCELGKFLTHFYGKI